MSASGSDTLPVEVREATPDDRGFIVQAWLRGYQRSPEVEVLTGPEYSPAQRDLINRILARGQAWIIFNREIPTQYFGFVVSERDSSLEVAVVHWVYVKKEFRDLGLARALLLRATGAAKTIYYTHRAPRRADEEKLRKRGARFNPYLR